MSWAVVVVNGVLGLALAIGAVVSRGPDVDRGFLTCFGITLATVAVAHWNSVLSQHESPLPRHDGGGVVIPWRNTSLVPVAAMSSLAVSTWLLAVVTFRHGEAVAAVAALVTAVVLTAILPDAWRRAVRGGRLRLHHQGLSARTTTTDVDLRWDDVAAVAVVWVGPTRQIVQVTARTEDSWTVRRIRRLLPWPREGGETTLDIPVHALDIPADRMAATLHAYVHNPYRRAELTTAAGAYRWQLLARR